jgi:hypothetical protein
MQAVNFTVRRQSLAEPRTFCATTGEWGKANCQLFGLIPDCQNQSKKLKVMLLKWVTMKDQ